MASGRERVSLYLVKPRLICSCNSLIPRRKADGEHRFQGRWLRRLSAAQTLSPPRYKASIRDQESRRQENKTKRRNGRQCCVATRAVRAMPAPSNCTGCPRVLPREKKKRERERARGKRRPVVTQQSCHSAIHWELATRFFN